MCATRDPWRRSGKWSGDVLDPLHAARWSDRGPWHRVGGLTTGPLLTQEAQANETPVMSRNWAAVREG